MPLAATSVWHVVALLLVAASVGLSNFAAAVGIGVGGVDARTRLRVGVVYGVFESGMPVVGLLLGARFAALIGHAARWTGALLLIVMGAYCLISSLRTGRRAQPRPDLATGGWLLLSGLALSLDNLVIGFALGTYQTPLLTGAVVIGAVSVALSMIGLELGARLGRHAGSRGEQLSGVILISVGIAIAAGALT
jgi:putative Mn2+ efflux pump MntP